MTNRTSGLPGTIEKKVDLAFVQPRKTTNEDVVQKLGWVDSGIKEEGLFVARWASSGSGWVWVAGSYNSGAEGTARNWTVHNLIVEFDDAGLVKSAHDVQTSELIAKLQSWIPQSPWSTTELASLRELRVFRHPQSPVPTAKLVLSTDSFGFQDSRTPKNDFQTPSAKIKRIRAESGDRIGGAPSVALIAVTVEFYEKAAAGKHVSFMISPSDLLGLIKYLYETNATPYAS